MNAPAKAFYDYRPSLFGETKRKVFVRRDKVNTDPNLNVTVSFLSGVFCFLLALLCFLAETLLATRLLKFAELLQQPANAI